MQKFLSERRLLEEVATDNFEFSIRLISLCANGKRKHAGWAIDVDLIEEKIKAPALRED